MIKPRIDDKHFNVLIEIAMNSDPVKYEFDKDANVMKVDRMLKVAMFYPCNYGFIPNTLSGDGDPVDVLVLTQYPILPNSLIAVRPVGVLMMEDESGIDEKILAVPHHKIDPSYKDISSIKDLPTNIKERISHFFEHYKTLDKDKWVKIQDWKDFDKAYDIIDGSINNYNKTK